MDWDTAAQELGRALSRYNGLTNSARLDLIADITGGIMFHQQPFAFAYKIRAYFEQHVEKRSAEVHMQHGIAFGLLYRALPGASFRSASLSSKLESTSHIALTPLGRTCRSAVKSGNTDLRNFILTYALLTADFDMYALLIKMASDNGGRAPQQSEFSSQFNLIMEKRLEWMKGYFPVMQREQIQRNIRWVGRRLGHGKTGKKREFVMDQIFTMGGETPNHHFRQRKKWAKNPLEHLDDSGNLTEAGRDLAERLPSMSADPFFWIGPSAECAKARFISAAQIDKKQYSPAWRILRPRSKLTDEAQDEMVDKVAEFMVSEFVNIQLGKYRQSSLDVVEPYLYFLEQMEGGKVNEHKFFRALLKKHRDKFACAQQPRLSQSHFRLR